VSVAAVLDLKNDRIETIRLALGGVAHKPWRATLAEKALTGAAPDAAVFTSAMEQELASAKAYAHNRFKIALAIKTAVGVLSELAAGAQL
jgi:xanthine dehydrogenase YagS FAD-binding subunit